MGNRTNLPPLALAGVALAVLAALGISCSTGPDPVPAKVSREAIAAAEQMYRAPDLLPETAALPGHVGAAPAPFGEAGGRERPAQRPRLVMAVGHGAAAASQPFANGFATHCPDLEGVFATTSDREALELVLVGRADGALFAGPLTAADLQAGLRATPLGVELWAVAVAPDFPLPMLNRSDLRQVLSGEVADWSQLGLALGPVVVATPADQRLASSAARALICGDRFAATAVRLGSERDIAALVGRQRGAIGVVRVTAERLAGARLMPIDGATPTAAAFAAGAYPFGATLQLVTAGPAGTMAQRWLQFARTEAGREALGRSLLLP